MNKSNSNNGFATRLKKAKFKPCTQPRYPQGSAGFAESDLRQYNKHLFNVSIIILSMFRGVLRVFCALSKDLNQLQICEYLFLTAIQAKKNFGDVTFLKIISFDKTFTHTFNNY